MKAIALLLALLAVAAVSAVSSAALITLSGAVASGTTTILLQGPELVAFHLVSDTAPIANATTVTVYCTTNAGATVASVTPTPLVFAVNSKVSTSSSFSYTLNSVNNVNTLTCNYAFAANSDAAFLGATLPSTTVTNFVLSVANSDVLSPTQLSPITRSAECVISPASLPAGFLTSIAWSGASFTTTVSLAVWRPTAAGGYTLVGSINDVSIIQTASGSAANPSSYFAVQEGDKVGACYTGRSPFYEQENSGSLYLTTWPFLAGSVLSPGTSVNGVVTSMTSTSSLNIRAFIGAVKPNPEIDIFTKPPLNIPSGTNATWTLSSSIPAGASGATFDSTCWWTTAVSVTTQSATNLGIFSLTPFVFAAGSSIASATLVSPSSGLGSFQCALTARTTGTRDTDWDLTNIPGFASIFNAINPAVTIQYGLIENAIEKLAQGHPAMPVQLKLLPAPTAGPVSIQVSCGTFATLVFNFSVGTTIGAAASLPAVAADASLSTYTCWFTVLRTDASRDPAYDTTTRAPSAVSIGVVARPNVHFAGISALNPTIPATQVSTDLTFESDATVSALGARLTFTCTMVGSATPIFAPVVFLFQSSTYAQTVKFFFPRAATATSYSCVFGTVTDGPRDTVLDLVTFIPAGPLTFTTAAGTPTPGGAINVIPSSSSTGAAAAGGSTAGANTGSTGPSVAGSTGLHASAHTASVSALTLLLAAAAIFVHA